MKRSKIGQWWYWHITNPYLILWYRLRNSLRCRCGLPSIDFLAPSETERRLEQIEIIVVDLLYQIMRDGHHPNTSIPLDCNQYLPALVGRANKKVADADESERYLGRQLTNFDLPGL